MFRRLICISQQYVRINQFGGLRSRHLHNDDGDNFVLIPGNVLESNGQALAQGRYREEKYFKDHDLELLAQMRSEGLKKLKCGNWVGNWTEYEKVLNACTKENALRDTSSLNKNKNCLEEAYFMDQQAESLKQLNDKLTKSTAKKDMHAFHDDSNDSAFD